MFRLLLIFSRTFRVQHIHDGVHLDDDEIEIERATTFEEGRTLFEASPFDMIVADWEIDGIGAGDVIDAFKKGGDTRFIILTDHTHEKMFERALNHGCDSFISRGTEGADAGDEVAMCNHLIRKMIRERDVEQVERLLLNNPMEGVAIIDSDGNVLYANMCAVSMFGLKAEQESLDLVKGMSAFDFIHPDEHDRVRFKNARMLDEYGYQKQEVRCRTVDGREVFIDVYATRIRFRGQLAEFAILRDVTEFHDKGTELELALDRLGTLNHITSHDMVNKLTAAMGYLELMRLEGSLDPIGLPLAQKLNTCLDDIRSMIAFTQDYQEAGHYLPVWFHVPLLKAQALRQAALHDVAMEIDLMDVEVFADPMLDRVMGNLIGNSIWHGGGVNRMRVWDTYDDGDYVLSLEDDGIGIPLDDKETIFEKGVGSNTGYGLFLVKSILGITGISIRENGVQGEGARFEIRVPKGRYR